MKAINPQPDTLTSYSGSDTLRQIKVWFEKAVPFPTDINISTQIGVHTEKMSEMFEPLQEVSRNQETNDQIAFFHDVLQHAQKCFKTHQRSFQLEFNHLDRTTLLDALCDQIVNAIGVAHMLEMDIEGALKEVARSNDSKFDHMGQPIFNDSSKIVKGPDYIPPALEKFV